MGYCETDFEIATRKSKCLKIISEMKQKYAEYYNWTMFSKIQTLPFANK